MQGQGQVKKQIQTKIGFDFCIFHILQSPVAESNSVMKSGSLEMHLFF